MQTIRILRTAVLAIASSLAACASLPSFDDDLAACSSHIVPGGNAVLVHMLNSGPDPIDVYWVSSSGKLVHYREVAPSSKYEQKTYVGHLWVALLRNRAVAAPACVMPGTERIEFGARTPEAAT